MTASRIGSMRVIEASGAGGPEVLFATRRNAPTANSGEVIVKVAYAGVNGPDLMQRRGLYPAPAGATKILGLEVAGEIASTGVNTHRWKVGDRVCALTNGGGYAEYCSVLEGHCLPIPDGMDLADAASLPEAYFTIWSNVFMGAGLRSGEVLLVHGGAGGLGSAAIQLATYFGATVVATDSPRQRLDFCASLGAARTIDYAVEDYVEIVRGTFGGADVIVDIVGGSNIQKNMKAARHDGRIVQLAFAQGATVQLDVTPLMLKRLHYTGSTLRSRSDTFKSEVARQLETEVWPLFAQRRLKAVVGRTLALEEAANAHRLMESAAHSGKIVLKI